MKPNDKRPAERAPLSSLVEYFVWRDRRTGRARDIGVDGLSLETSPGEAALAPGALLTLRVRLPGSDHGFTVLGRVRPEPTQERLLDVEFLDLAPRDRALVRQLVDARRVRAAA